MTLYSYVEGLYSYLIPLFALSPMGAAGKKAAARLPSPACCVPASMKAVEGKEAAGLFPQWAKRGRARGW